MDYTSPIKGIIAANAAAYALVAGRVYPVLAPQRSTYPLVVVTLVGERPVNTKNEASDIDDSTIQVDVYGSTHAAVSNAAEKIRMALDYFRGDIEYNSVVYGIDLLMHKGTRSSIESNPEVFRQSMDFMICIKRDGLIGNEPVEIPDFISIEDGDTFDIAAGKLLLGIAVEADAGGDRVLSVGTTANGTQIFDNEEIDDGQDVFLGRNQYFSNNTTFHFSGFTGTMNIRIYKI